ncbi:DUF397 domain-containing protein [Kitasatospora mediocidica]|uniref:DUF397 domain-containing protein n=1 Tax=Kitasatospora mediocidica TaxID=58352 RepID=UPI00056A0493|nr:DUF397 domain-containing protein [Kitasatospora mediocidica]
MTSASRLPVTWHKSSYSGSNQGQCVEVGTGLTDAVPVRDSKDPHGPALVFSTAAFADFLRGVRDGAFGN